MTKIVVSLKDADLHENVLQCLKETKYTVESIAAFNFDDGLQALAEQIAMLKADVIVTDYIDEDALSVKLMQTINNLSCCPHFVFLETGEAESSREQVLMAINEGARAFLPKNFNPASLLNYVSRAASGPVSLRHHNMAEACANDDAMAALEESLGDIRIKSDRFQTLISYLLATAVSSQARKVLVVSDSPYQLEMMRKILEDHNFYVLVSSDADEALTIALNEKPRIIISDLELENQTGIELCQAIKFTHRLVPCYYVICTANQDKVNTVMQPGNGVDDCVIKASGPKDTVDFISRIALGLLL